MGGVGQFHGVADQLIIDDDDVHLDQKRQVYVGAAYGVFGLRFARYQDLRRHSLRRVRHQRARMHGRSVHEHLW